MAHEIDSEMADLTPDDDRFLHAIAADMRDPLPRLAYADWLEEHGRMNEATRMRANGNTDFIVDKFQAMIGRTINRIEYTNEEIVFHDSEGGYRYQFNHNQSCCEQVWVEDVDGDWKDLMGTPILVAESVSCEAPASESGTWTFYKFATVRGHVTVRWGGYSNGYYSECVSFEVLT